MVKRNNFISVILGCCFAALPALNHAVTVVNTRWGQHAYHGEGGCTVIDVSAATQVLALSPAQWRRCTSGQLAQFIQNGVKQYNRELARYRKRKGFWFQAIEIVPHIARLQQLSVINVVKTLPAAADLAVLQAAGEQVVPLEGLTGAIRTFGNAVCGVWTKRGASQLICFKNNTWLFLDSHQQSSGKPGASMYVFNTEREFQQFLKKHAVFKFGVSTRLDNQANVTVFRLKGRVPALVVAVVKKLQQQERACKKRLETVTKQMQKCVADIKRLTRGGRNTCKRKLKKLVVEQRKLKAACEKLKTQLVRLKKESD